MRFISKKSTIGALNRRFERDMVFQHGKTIAGPGATHAGPNPELALRFGTYDPVPRPFSFRVFGLVVVIGGNAGVWARLSDMERPWIASRRFSVGLR